MMMTNATRGTTCVYCLNFHVVFCTKYRYKVFETDALRAEMKQIFLNIAKETEVKIKTQEVMSDHVHMIISFHPKHSISDIVKKIKGSSAKIFNNRHRDLNRRIYRGEGVLWSPGYYVGSLGDMSKATVEKYIANQYKEPNKSH